MFLFIFLVLPPCAKPLTVGFRLLVESGLLIVVAGALALNLGQQGIHVVGGDGIDGREEFASGWLALGIVVGQHFLNGARIVEAEELAGVLLH